MKSSSHALNQRWQNLSVKGQIVNILDFLGLTVSVPTSQLYHCSAKVAIHDISMNECDCVPIKLHLQKPAVYWVCGELYFTNFCFKLLCFKVLRRQKSEDNYRPIETLVFKIRRDYSLNYQKKSLWKKKHFSRACEIGQIYLWAPEGWVFHAKRTT